MQIKKFLKVVLMGCSILMSNSNANDVYNEEIVQYDEVYIEFRANDKYYLECNGNKYLFKDIYNFSHFINKITHEYFSTSLVDIISGNKTIIFNNFHSKKANYIIHLSAEYGVCNNIVFDYCDNDVKVPEIVNLNNISKFNIYSRIINVNNDSKYNIDFFDLHDEALQKGFFNDEQIDKVMPYR